VRGEMTRPVRPSSLGQEGRTERLEARPEELAALAARLGLVALDALEAEIALAPAPGGAVRARGILRARVVQACVVTLEPVPQAVEAPIDWRVLPPGEAPSDEMDSGPDEIESEPDGSVDLGEALVQELALSLDPYPRAPGAEVPGEARDEAPSPFAGLAGLRRG